MLQKINNVRLARSVTFILLLSLTISPIAKAADALTIDLKANQVIIQEGKTVLKPVTRANSGDIIQYQATYRNNIEKPMTNVALTLPVPANMVYVNSGTPAPVQASLDGKKFENLPIMRKINDKMIEVPASQYRAVRWILKTLPAKQVAVVTINTKVQ